MADGKLLSGQSLRPEQTLVSAGSQARLHYQGDGNLVVYLDGVPFWSSRTDGRTAGSLTMQRDGNLVISDNSGPVASTGTHGHPGAMVQLQDDGNFVIYEDPNGPLAGTPIWASSTGAFTVGLVEPAPVEPNPNAIQGTLHQSGWRTTDDTGDKIPLFAHAMSLFALFVRDPAAAQRQAQVLARRYGGVRVCDILGYWDRNRPGNGDQWTAWITKEVTPFAFRSYGERHIPTTPDYYTRKREFVTMLHECGLKIMDDRGDMNALTRTQKLQHMHENGRLYGSLPFGRDVLAGVWAVNEGWQNGASAAEGGIPLCEDMLAAFRDGAGWWPDVRGLSAPGGVKPDGTSEYGPELPDDIKAWSVTPATAMTIHGSRAINEHLIPHYFGYGYDRAMRDANKKVWNTEPIGGGRGVSVGELNDVEILCGVAAQALATGQQFTFMSGHGVFGGAAGSWDGNTPGTLDAPIEAMPGYEEVARIPSFLPSDIYAFNNIFHSGTTFAHKRIVAANDYTRFDTSVHGDGRFVALVHTFHGKALPLTVQRACSAFTVIDLVTGNIERSGPLNRNDMFTHRGRVRLVVGKLA